MNPEKESHDLLYLMSTAGIIIVVVAAIIINIIL